MVFGRVPATSGRRRKPPTPRAYRRGLRRGERARPHTRDIHADGAAKSLTDVVNFYNRRFNIGFTADEIRKVVLFLEQT